MPVTCGYCQKSYSEKAARCPFCNTPGGHAPPPLPPQPARSPAQAATQDPELKKKLLAAAVQLKSDAPDEYSQYDKFSLSNLTSGMRAALVLGLLAALNALGGLFLLVMPVEPGDRLTTRATGAGALFAALVFGGLGFGAWRGVILCVWIGAGLILLEITLGGIAGIFIKALILVALVKFALQMKEEQL